MTDFVKSSQFSISIHPGATKMYCDLRKVDWWNDVKEIAKFVAKCPNVNK